MIKLSVVVMLGGPGAEREVSLRSGAAVARALRSRGHRVTELDPVDPSWHLPAGVQVVFLALHGTYGEDGTVQQRLEELGVPYSGCGPEVSRIAFDKILSKERFIGAGVPTPRFVTVENSAAPWPRGWNPPVVVKPARQGSSVGLQFVDRVADWETALGEAMRYDQRVLVEEKVAGRETTVGILAGEALPVVEVRPKSGVYDYRSKYTAGQTEYLCPAPLDASVCRNVRAAALGAFASVGGGDYARVDVIVKPNGEPSVLEINTLPGMTETSLLPKAAAAVGLEYGPLCERMLELAIQRHRAR